MREPTEEAKNREFKDAFERHSDELFRHGVMRLSDRERVLELTQECFLKVWEYVSRGNEVRDLRAFLFQTMRNLIIDEYRRHRPFSLEAIVEDSESSTDLLLPPDETNTLEAAMERHEGRRALSAVATLPDLYREVLLLRYVDGLTPKEIANIVGESENVVSVRLHRGLKKLKDVLEEKRYE